MSTSKPSPDAGLLAEAKRIAQQFDLSPDDIARAADYCLGQVRMCLPSTCAPNLLLQIRFGLCLTQR